MCGCPHKCSKQVTLIINIKVQSLHFKTHLFEGLVSKTKIKGISSVCKFNLKCPKTDQCNHPGFHYGQYNNLDFVLTSVPMGLLGSGIMDGLVFGF